MYKENESAYLYGKYIGFYSQLIQMILDVDKIEIQQRNQKKKKYVHYSIVQTTV